MSAEWTNKVSSGNLPYVTVECRKCSGKAVLEKVFEGTRFLHCCSAEVIPREVFEAYAQAKASFKAGKPVGGNFAVRYI